jgi:peptidase S46-like protein
MWLFDHFGNDQLPSSYGFMVTSDFLKHLERASVRFNNGGSSSFISPHGLLLTNQHVGQDCIQRLSSSGHDYVANGFSAVDGSRERACPDLEVDELLSSVDVTAKVNDGIDPETSSADANRKRVRQLHR